MTRVLIVDDHEIVRRGLKQILTDEFAELQVGEAGDARQALEAARQHPWDIVLLDINMPGRSGLDVLEDLKSLRPGMPVVVLSAFPEADFAFRSLKLGACGYVNKQSASDELLAAIRKGLAGGRYITPTLAEKLAASLAGDFSGAPHETLSNRELQVLRLIASGRTIKEIATQLCLSEKTVGTYRTRISDKMGLASNVEITRYALQHKLVD
jgi:two-component system, NarL family, invasion response regulator UvrY